MRRILPLLVLLVSVAAGCTRPPYAAPGKDLTAVNEDYTDCFTEASLTVNTPPFPAAPLRQRDKETDACMVERGYTWQWLVF
ncbi:MAG: hypothetical protein AAGU21_00110 [Solidesulfovibrio sp.]|uniref:hypothetical protein n=1 Tax=Solidesulfovibrio sp. TaxID=2910990 RepID=UPI002B2101E6|nr:hypothetical protein [Solidesulfovibrio sp.]MEA4857010.1 hypothetical protein [Solidesulfovibrio sp.]